MPEPKKIFTALQHLVVESLLIRAYRSAGKRFLYKNKEINIMRENCNLYCLTSSRRFLLTLYYTFWFYQFQAPALIIAGVGEGVCSRLLVGAGGLQVCRHPRRGPVTQRLLLRAQGIVIFMLEFPACYFVESVTWEACRFTLIFICWFRIRSDHHHSSRSVTRAFRSESVPYSFQLNVNLNETYCQKISIYSTVTNIEIYDTWYDQGFESALI